MKKHIVTNLMGVVLLVFCASLSAQQTIKVNTDESKVKWTGKKPTGEHHGYVKLSDGYLNIQNNTVKGGSFTMDMKTITNIDLTDKESNQKLVNHLKSKEFFDVERFPTAKYTITNVSRIKNDAGDVKKATHRIDGELTIKGITKKVSFDASINMLNGKFAANTPEFTINRTDWNVNYQSKSVFAGLRDEFIFDDITLSIELVSQ